VPVSAEYPVGFGVRLASKVQILPRITIFSCTDTAASHIQAFTFCGFRGLQLFSDSTSSAGWTLYAIGPQHSNHQNQGYRYSNMS
jgi:hypothetical protein